MRNIPLGEQFAKQIGLLIEQVLDFFNLLQLLASNSLVREHLIWILTLILILILHLHLHKFFTYNKPNNLQHRAHLGMFADDLVLFAKTGRN